MVARSCQKGKAILIAAHVGDSRRQAVGRWRLVAAEEGKALNSAGLRSRFKVLLRKDRARCPAPSPKKVESLGWAITCKPGLNLVDHTTWVRFARLHPRPLSAGQPIANAQVGSHKCQHSRPLNAEV